MNLTHLFMESHYSMNGSNISFPSLIRKAKELGFSSLALTDQKMHGVIEINVVGKSETTIHFYKYLEEGKIYLQHNFKGADHFKDIKWFWNKDTSFLNSGEARKQEKANKTYKSVKDWIFYCGGRNSGLWHPKWLNE